MRFIEHTNQVMAESRIQFVGIVVGTGNIEEWDEDTSETNPECTVRGKGKGTKGVAAGEFPHPSTELGETAVGKSCQLTRRQN